MNALEMHIQKLEFEFKEVCHTSDYVSKVILQKQLAKAYLQLSKQKNHGGNRFKRANKTAQNRASRINSEVPKRQTA